MNSDRDRNQVLLKTPVIVPYYLFLVMELEMCYSLISFVILLNLRFVNMNSCSQIIVYLRLLLILKETTFVITLLLTVTVGKCPNLAFITV